MKIIITRPEEDAGPLSEKLTGLGHEIFVLPLLKIVGRETPQIPRRPYQVICLTSANAARVLADISPIKDIPVLAVGPHSIRMALDKGFARVEAQGGDVNGMHQFMTTHLVIQAGPILYLSGSETSGDLEGRLKHSGFDVDRVITYDAMPASLEGKQSEIRNAQAVVLYSPRSAKLWVQEIGALNCDAAAHTIKHICLSANVAACLPQSWPRAIAEIPTEAALLALLD